MMIWVSKLKPLEFSLKAICLSALTEYAAISRMEFGEVGTQDGVLERRQDPVSDEFVERHSSPSSRPLLHHAGSKNRICVAVEEWLDYLRKALRRVLTVTVEHDDDVQSVLDCQVVADLLIPAVPQIGRLPDQGNWQRGDLLVLQPDLVRRVLAVVVADDHLFYGGVDLDRNPIKNLGQSRRCVVGDDEDADLLPLSCRHIPVLL